MSDLLKNFVTIENFRFERPRLSTMTDEQIQEALNIASGLIDSVCNGLVSLVIQYSLSKETKDQNNELYRTDFEIQQIKNAIVFQTQYVINLGNDFTIGSSSASTGGINYSFQRPESRQELAPGVKEFLARARVFELTNVGGNHLAKEKKPCDLLKTLLNVEDGDLRYLQKFQPNAEVGSIATIGDGHTIQFSNPSNAQWSVKQAEMIKDKGGDYYYLWDYPDLAFFGDNVENAISKREAYNAIWNAMWWNKNTTYPNEAIVRYYDGVKNIVYTFKSNQDANLGHNPINDNENEYWWKQVSSNDNVDIDALANSVIGNKIYLDSINAINNEINSQLEAFWEQIKDNPHFLKKLEELYDQTKTENEQLETKLDTKIQTNINKITQLETNYNALNASNIAYKNKNNEFVNQTIKGSTAFVEFRRENNQRNGYIGKSSSNSNNIEINAETNNLNLKANIDINLDPLGNATYSKAPTKDNHIANKKYVDTLINGINTDLDTNNLAKLDRDNQWRNEQTFNLVRIAQGQLANMTGEPSTLVNKGYVDSEVTKVDNKVASLETTPKPYRYTSPNFNFTQVNQIEIGSVITFIQIKAANWAFEGIPPRFRNKRCFVIFEIFQVQSENGTLYDCNVTTTSTLFNIGNQVQISIALPSLYFVGPRLRQANGDFGVNLKYRITLFEGEGNNFL